MTDLANTLVDRLRNAISIAIDRLTPADANATATAQANTPNPDPVDVTLTADDFDADGWYRHADSIHVTGTLTIDLSGRWARFRGGSTAGGSITAGGAIT